MNREIEYIVYLKTLANKLNKIVRKIDNYVDLTDGDREIVKITLDAFLKMEKNL